MTGLAHASTGYSLLTGLGCLLIAALGRRRPTWLTLALVLTEVAALATCAVDLFELLGGAACSEPVVHLSYLATAVAVLPVTAAVMSSDRGRWGTAGLGVGCLILAVVLLRLVATRHS